MSVTAEAKQKIIKDNAKAKFVEAVDVAVRLGVDAKKSDQQVRGSTVLPAGTGKSVRVAVFCPPGAKADEARKASFERRMNEAHEELEDEWRERYDSWKSQNAEDAKLFLRALAGSAVLSGGGGGSGGGAGERRELNRSAPTHRRAATRRGQDTRGRGALPPARPRRWPS